MKKFGDVRKSASSKLATTFVMCAALGYAIAAADERGCEDAVRYHLILSRFVSATKQCVKFVPAPGDEDFIKKAVDFFELRF